MKSFTHIRQRPRSNKGTGVFLATTVAALFATAPVAQAAPQEVVIHCTGVNACKGQGRCGTAEHSCIRCERLQRPRNSADESERM